MTAGFAAGAARLATLGGGAWLAAAGSTALTRPLVDAKAPSGRCSGERLCNMERTSGTPPMARTGKSVKGTAALTATREMPAAIAAIFTPFILVRLHCRGPQPPESRIKLFVNVVVPECKRGLTGRRWPPIGAVESCEVAGDFERFQ